VLTCLVPNLPRARRGGDHLWIEEGGLISGRYSTRWVRNQMGMISDGFDIRWAWYQMGLVSDGFGISWVSISWVQSQIGWNQVGLESDWFRI
jgi:hypothetical protein